MDGSISKTLETKHSQDLKIFRQIGWTQQKIVGKFYINASIQIISLDINCRMGTIGTPPQTNMKLMEPSRILQITFHTCWVTYMLPWLRVGDQHDRPGNCWTRRSNKTRPMAQGFESQSHIVKPYLFHCIMGI